MKPNDRELLQKAQIIIDLKKRYIDEIKRYGLAAALMILIFIVFLSIITDLSINLPTILCAVFFGFLCAFMGAIFCYNVYKYFSATNNFKIEIERLADKKNIYRYHHRQIENYKYLYFSNGKRFQPLPALSFSPNKGGFYSWSKLNQMDENELFRSSACDDEFYLITQNNKIIYVYNTKFFKLSNELENSLNK